MIWSNGSVEDVLASIDATAPTSNQLTIRIHPRITLRGETLPFDFAMALILDRLLSFSMFPRGFVDEPDGWRAYSYERE